MKILAIMTIDSATLQPPTGEDMERMGAFIEETRRSGVLIDTGGVMDGMLELKVSRKDGRQAVTDGPFTESKEVVGGYALFDVAGRDEAIAFTTKFLELVRGDVTCHLHEVSAA